MKVDRVISTISEIEKKIKETHALLEHWSTKWIASEETNQQYYKKMVFYETLIKHYRGQIKKRLEKEEKNKLQNLCSDLTSFTNRYLNSHHFFSINPARKKSIERLLQHSEEAMQNTRLSTEGKLVEIAGFLVKELNDTELSHNNNLFSIKCTKSRLARTYMRIFEENGINPTTHALVKKANEFESDETDNFCHFIPKLF